MRLHFFFFSSPYSISKYVACDREIPFFYAIMVVGREAVMKQKRREEKGSPQANWGYLYYLQAYKVGRKLCHSTYYAYNHYKFKVITANISTGRIGKINDL